jgi:putative transposase
MNIENILKEYNTDGKMVYSCQYHVIFAPKYRRKVLINGVDTRLKQIILDKQTEYKYKIIEMEVMPDHVHLLIDSNPKIGIYNQITKIKGMTSNILRNEFPWLKTKLPSLWTRSKFVSTVGSISLETVKKYIENQKNI